MIENEEPFGLIKGWMYLSIVVGLVLSWSKGTRGCVWWCHPHFGPLAGLLSFCPVVWGLPIQGYGQDVQLDWLHEKQGRLGQLESIARPHLPCPPLYSQSLPQHLALGSHSIIFAEQLNWSVQFSDWCTDSISWVMEELKHLYYYIEKSYFLGCMLSFLKGNIFKYIPI